MILTHNGKKINLLLVSLFCFASFQSLSRDGNGRYFFLQEVKQFSMKFEQRDNLIVLPFLINDSIEVNLILDTGSSGVILGGRRFRPMMSYGLRKVSFGGLGDRKALHGTTVLNNVLQLGNIKGEDVPVVIVAQKIFPHYQSIDGVIGFDFLCQFEVEINSVTRTISFRRPTNQLPAGFTIVPLRMDGYRPMVKTSFEMDKEIHHCDMMFDTGSSFGILLFDTTVSIDNFNSNIIGRGMSGSIKGITRWTKWFNFDKIQIEQVPVSVTTSIRDKYVSLGMGLLKEYQIIINYCNGYIAFKKRTW